MASHYSDPALLTATELLAAYRNRSLSPVEATKAVIARIRRIEPILNTFAFIDEAGALAAAARSEQRWVNGEAGRLEGVPVSIKDNVAVAGMPMRRGSRTSSSTPVTEDAPAAARLR